ncbi:MAG: acyl-CoA dehydrogenase family protein [Rhodospirillales bacterium]|nr:acyl-CoA dehydrogenase family protein [Rhodospirillales bacterium]
MIDYRAPLDDILFAIEVGAEAERLPGWDGDLVRQMLGEAARFVEAEVAPLDPVADAVGAKLDGGRVRLPPGFRAVYAKYREGGWPGLTAPEAFGGQNQPVIVYSALSEMLAGSCAALHMVLALIQGTLRTIAAHGSADQKALWLPRLISGEWLTTMCLSEPQAGSDLGLCRTKAEPQADGSWSISGGKIFISGGDHDLVDGILHLVLARTGGPELGTKGLGLFLCPSILPDGTRNRVSVVRIEEKMGLHGSPTCQMAFDGAKAEIVGAPGEGLMRMFTMMNALRVDVGIQGVAYAEIARQRAQAYAAERKQGRGGDGATALINRHGDVRRMLMAQSAFALACRALVYRTAVELDLGQRPALVDFLTPIGKTFASEAAIESAHLAVQVHGGYGYLREYRVEQILRDSRITAIYEGANGIHAMNMAGRLVRQGNGACLTAFRDDIGLAIAKARPESRDSLGFGLAQWEGATKAILARTDPSLAAASYLRLCGILAAGAALFRLEAQAERAPNPERLMAAALYWRGFLMPETRLLAERVESLPDGNSLPEKAFIT